MKLMTVAFVFLSSVGFAKEKDRNPAADAPSIVNETAAKMKEETRTRVSAYNVSAKEANGCSEAGLHYNIKLQVKKQVRGMDKKDQLVFKHTWETVRELDIGPEGIPMEICAE